MKSKASPENLVHIPVLNLIRKHVTRFVWHTPNGGWRSMWDGLEMKKLGARSGVPDLAFVIAGQAYFIECKAPGGRLDPNQITFRDEARAAGARWAVVKSKQDAIEALQFWGLLPANFEREAA